MPVSQPIKLPEYYEGVQGLSDLPFYIISDFFKEYYLSVAVFLLITVLLWCVDKILLLYVEYQENLQYGGPSIASSLLNGSGFYRYYQYRRSNGRIHGDDDVDFIMNKIEKTPSFLSSSSKSNRSDWDIL